LLDGIPDRFLHIIRVSLITHLIELKEISSSFLSTDSSAVPVVIRENKLKVSVTALSLHFIRAGKNRESWGKAIKSAT